MSFAGFSNSLSVKDFKNTDKYLKEQYKYKYLICNYYIKKIYFCRNNFYGH